VNDSMKSLLKTGVSVISRADYGKNSGLIREYQRQKHRSKITACMLPLSLWEIKDVLQNNKIIIVS